MSAGAGGSDAEPLVLVHGLNSTPAIWDGVIAALPPGVAARPVTCPALADVDAVAAAMLADLPPAFWLCGHSFGGYVALAMLAAAPQRVRGVALLSTTARGDTERQKAARRAAVARTKAGDYDAMMEAQGAFVCHPDNVADPGLVALRGAMARAYGPACFITHLEACMARPDRSAVLAAAIVPVLVVTGEADQVIPVDRQRAMAEAVPGACFVTIAGAGHMLPAERPGAVAAALAAWMAVPAANRVTASGAL